MSKQAAVRTRIQALVPTAVSNRWNQHRPHVPANHDNSLDIPPTLHLLPDPGSPHIPNVIIFPIHRLHVFLPSSGAEWCSRTPDAFAVEVQVQYPTDTYQSGKV